MKSAVAKAWTLKDWLDGTKRTLTPISFPVGVWVQLTPPGIPTEDGTASVWQGLTLDWSQPGTIYACNGPTEDVYGGLFKSRDAGYSWTLLGDGQFENPLHLRVDPDDSDRLYLVCGVRGVGMGFWRSFDGGDTWAKPAGFASAVTAAGITGPGTIDMYDCAVDPTDFDHILVSFHFDWGATFDNASGVMESLDGGDTWTVHAPEATWGTGHSINFLYDVATTQGDSDTWLLGTQGDGMWRTTNGGTSWTQVTIVPIAHGGSRIYYDPAGALYVGGFDTLKSTNNGSSFTSIYNDAWSITGYGTTLLANRLYNVQPLEISTDGGATWDDIDATTHSGGCFDMTYDPSTQILWASFPNTGVWARRMA